MAHILFVDMHANTSLARLPGLFKAAGVQCSGLAFKDKILLQTNALEQRFLFPEGALAGSMNKMAGALASAQQQCQPDFLLSNDEVFLRNLLGLRKNLRSGGDNRNTSQRALLKLLEVSFLQDDSLYSRANNLEIAQEAGFRAPDSITAESVEDLRSKVPYFGFPCYLKRNFESGGAGVSVISNTQDLDAFISQFSKTEFRIDAANPILAQKAVSGVEVTVNFVSWKGQLLGYDVVQPLKAKQNNGPSTVVQTLYRPQWEAAIQLLVQHLNYTGFGGLDLFENKGSDIPEVIEVNLRPPHSLQVATQLNSFLIRKFAAKLMNTPEPDKTIPVHQDNNRIATIFPDELFRDKNSVYALTTPSNIPWNDTNLLSVFFNKLQIKFP